MRLLSPVRLRYFQLIPVGLDQSGREISRWHPPSPPFGPGVVAGFRPNLHHPTQTLEETKKIKSERRPHLYKARKGIERKVIIFSQITRPVSVPWAARQDSSLNKAIKGFLLRRMERPERHGFSLENSSLRGFSEHFRANFYLLCTDCHCQKWPSE